jgi:hypothetical protein
MGTKEFELFLNCSGFSMTRVGYSAYALRCTDWLERGRGDIVDNRKTKMEEQYK